MLGKALVHGFPCQLRALPTQFGHEVLFHGFAKSFNVGRTAQRFVEVAQGTFPPRPHPVCCFMTPPPSRPSGAGKGKRTRGKCQAQCPVRPRRPGSRQEPTRGGQDVPNVLVEHLHVLLVAEGHAGGTSVSGASTDIQLKRGSGAFDMGSRQGVKRHRLKRRHGVVSRSARNGHKFESPRARFPPSRHRNVVLHFGIEHLKLRGPRELRLPEELQIPRASKAHFHRDRFIREHAVRRHGLADRQVGEGAQRLRWSGLGQRKNVNGHGVARGFDLLAFKEVDPHVAVQLEVFQNHLAGLLGKGDNLFHCGHIVTLAIDELGLPPCFWGGHCLLPKTLQFRDVVVADIQIGESVVDLVGQHERFAQIHRPFARFDGGDEVTLNGFGALPRLGLRPRTRAAFSGDIQPHGSALQDPFVGGP